MPSVLMPGPSLTPMGFAPGGAAGPLLKDTFTDVDNTALTSHVMDVGSGWTMGDTGVAKISSNTCIFTSAGLAQANAGASDVTATLDVEVNDGSNLDSALLFRYTDDNHWFEATLNNGIIRLWKFNAGFTSLGAVSVTTIVGNTYTIKVTTSGSTINVYVNGVLEIGPVTDSFNSTATKFGMREKSVTFSNFDNFQVTSP